MFSQCVSHLKARRSGELF